MPAVVSMKQLLEAGVHFGHQTRRWNPKMAEYIFTERNGIYIIDLQKTVKKLNEAYMFARDIAAEGGDILFVGTKKQAQDSVKEEAEHCGMPYVNARWLGGMLTNYDRIAAHCSNIAVAILELDSSNFDMHEYTKSVRKLKDNNYVSTFDYYEQKYNINGYQPEAEQDTNTAAKAATADTAQEAK